MDDKTLFERHLLLRMKDDENLNVYSNEDLISALIQASKMLGEWHQYLDNLEWNNPKLLSYQKTMQELDSIQNKIKVELLVRLNKEN